MADGAGSGERDEIGDGGACAVVSTGGVDGNRKDGRENETGEGAAVDRVDEPNTVSSLAANVRDLGVEAGDTLLVHSSMQSLGWVCGGAPAVVDALRRVVTESGTLVMPTHSAQYSDPGNWLNPPVPDPWEETIRETMPPYRPAITPTRGVGAIPECFRTYPDVLRSDHPTGSFAAWGANARTIVTDHSLDYQFGERSPLARVYDLDGDVLLLGVGHDANTSLHLAETRAHDSEETEQDGAPILEDGRRVWIEFENVPTRTDDFPDLGADFEREVGTTVGNVGAATAKLIRQRELVDFGVEWLAANR